MQETTSTPELLQTPAAASYLGISVSTLHRWTSRREIPFYKPGGKLLYFSRLDLDAWLLRNRIPTTLENSATMESQG